MNFLSDNCAPTHPAIMAALAAANEGFALSYGKDTLTHRAEDRLREVLDAPEAGVFFTATGTAANALVCGALAPSYGRIFCHEDAHINTSECGAPEMFTGGAKLSTMPGEGGKITAQRLDQHIRYWANEGVGAGQNAMVSITNATEWGAIYTRSEIEAIGTVCRDHGLALHMDGSRFANVVVAGPDHPADLTHRAGVDALSFGGTKNGCLGAEAVVMFDPDAADRLIWGRKRSGHLLSKHRYLAAQFDAMLTDGLWLDLARHANEMAADLGHKLAGIDGVDLVLPVATNQVFVTLPTALSQRLADAGVQFQDWPLVEPTDPTRTRIRLVTSWATAPSAMDALMAALTG